MNYFLWDVQIKKTTEKKKKFVLSVRHDLFRITLNQKVS